MKIIPADTLLSAYAMGVFPMAEDGEILWFEPKMRGLIPLDDRFHVSKSLNKTLRKRPFEVVMDRDFAAIMNGCAARETTWIDETIKESYTDLHRMGFAHSVECWDDDGLQGGLYGVKLGNAFFGESMYSRKMDVSKIALVYLVEWLRETGAVLLDTQWMTDHLRQFGGYEITRDDYQVLLQEALEELYIGSGNLEEMNSCNFPEQV